jgi:hypothetical protein
MTVAHQAILAFSTGGSVMVTVMGSRGTRI